MKAIEVPRYGGPEVLKVVDKPQPVPGPGQILIETRAAGINFADLMSRAGTYPPAPKPPFVPGFEAAGVVVEVGEGVTNHKVGDRVAAMTASGYAEYAVAEAATATPLPDGLGFAEATALLAQGLTAYFLLQRAVALAPGQSVLISAAAGGVGSLAVQIAKLLGAETVIGLASTQSKRDWVVGLGADAAIDYTVPGWTDAVREATAGRGADVYLDATGDFTEGLKTLAQGGTWVLYGTQSGPNAGLSGEAMSSLMFASQTVRGFTLYSVLSDAAALTEALQTLIGWTMEGRLKIEAGSRFPLTEAAHLAIEARKTTGKVVLEP